MLFLPGPGPLIHQPQAVNLAAAPSTPVNLLASLGVG